MIPENREKGDRIKQNMQKIPETCKFGIHQLITTSTPDYLMCTNCDYVKETQERKERLNNTKQTQLHK